jgi:hypothetical protein
MVKRNMVGLLSPSTLFGLLAKLVTASPVTSADWTALNQTVGGRLHTGVPFSEPCFSLLAGGVSNTPNATQCAEIQSRNEDHRTFFRLLTAIGHNIELDPSSAIVFRSEHFGAYEITQWETCQTNGDECLLDWTNPLNSAAFAPPQQCRQGSVPNFYVRLFASSRKSYLNASASEDRCERCWRRAGSVRVH